MSKERIKELIIELQREIENTLQKDGLIGGKIHYHTFLPGYNKGRGYHLFHVKVMPVSYKEFVAIEGFMDDTAAKQPIFMEELI